MRRTICMTAALLGPLAATSGAPALPWAGGGSARPVALVRVVECSRGAEAVDRHATFRATMRRVPGTQRMSMRFSLQERVGDGSFRTVEAPGLRTWRKSLPSVRRFSYRQRVLELAEGSAYRAVVHFRWFDGEGELIRRAKRRSGPCGQPGSLPNLSILRVRGGPPLAGAPRSSTYAVRVINRGAAPAPRFGVSFSVDGGVVDTQSVAGFSPGEARDLVFAGPSCQASITARVDPEDAVREASEKDNLLSVPCPVRR